MGTNMLKCKIDEIDADLTPKGYSKAEKITMGSHLKDKINVSELVSIKIQKKLQLRN